MNIHAPIRMIRLPKLSSSLACATMVAGWLSVGPAHALKVHLPAETVTYQHSELPGFTLTQRHCLTCHSSQYVSTQPSTFQRAFWDATVKKMRETYHASIPEADLPLIAEYLSHTYGADQDKPAASQLAAAQPGTQPAPARSQTTIDVDKLMADNACTACHAIDRKIVGPAFQEVARHYAGQPDAVALLVAHIRDGGSGRWGPVPMPPQPDLNPQELEALANWVMSRNTP